MPISRTDSESLYACRCAAADFAPACVFVRVDVAPSGTLPFCSAAIVVVSSGNSAGGAPGEIVPILPNSASTCAFHFCPAARCWDASVAALSSACC